jgi:arsenate reductase (glutaredoxin)
MTMNIQIFGRKDCSDSRKAERWFKERGIAFQFVDLKQKGLSPRELETVARPIGLEALLDRQGARFKAKGLAFMSPSRTTSVLLEDPLLLRTPIVRNGKFATLGFCPDAWQSWREAVN